MRETGVTKKEHRKMYKYGGENFYCNYLKMNCDRIREYYKTSKKKIKECNFNPASKYFCVEQKVFLDGKINLLPEKGWTESSTK